MRGHRSFGRWSRFLLAAVVITGCSDSGDSGGNTSPPSVGPTAATSTATGGRAVVVAYDSNTNAVKFVADDASILASAAVPVGFAPIRRVRASAFLHGAPIDGALTVADASTMTVTTYQIPPGLNQVEEVNGTTILLYSAPFAPSATDAVMLDMSSGKMTSMRDAIGRPSASWQQPRSGTDSVVLVDVGAFRSLVVPRDDPSAAWEADSIITGQIGDTFVGLTRPQSGSGVVVHAYRGQVADDAGGALDRLTPSATVGAFLQSADQLIVADKSGAFSQIDLNSGNVAAAGSLTSSLESVMSIAETVVYATGSGSDALLSISPFKVIDVGGHGPFIDYGSGSRCALIEQEGNSFADTKSFVIDLQSTTVLAELGPEPSPLAADGCSAVDALRKTVVLNGSIADVGGGSFFDSICGSVDGDRARC